MRTKYKIYLSQKNCNNNKQQNKKETINNNYLKQNEKFPNIQKKKMIRKLNIQIMVLIKPNYLLALIIISFILVNQITIQKSII